MIPARLALPSFAVLALAACAPSGDEDDKRAPGPPLGFELAMAREAPDNSEAAATEATVVDWTPEMLNDYLESGRAVLVDVRTPEEFAEGHLAGATLMPLDEFDPAELNDDPDMTVILYCRSGRRSQIAGEALAAHRGEPTIHLAGGILAWEEASFPVVRP